MRVATIDEVREFWDRRPCNVRHSALEVGSREYFEEVSRRRYMLEPHIVRFAEFERWRGKHVYEIGCGIGTDAVMFAKHGALSVYGVDISRSSIDLAIKNAWLRTEGECVAIQQSESELPPLPAYPVDLVYSCGVLHHTPNPEAMLHRIRKISYPGTTLKLLLYHRRSLKVLGVLARHGFKFWKTDELVARESEAQSNCPLTRTYTKKSARELVERHGFRVTDLFVDHVFRWRIPDYVERRLVEAWPYRVLPAPVMGLLRRHLGWHICLTATRV